MVLSFSATGLLVWPLSKIGFMTPKQCAAKLLLNMSQIGASHPSHLDRHQMSDALGLRISDEKRLKILGFVTKIEDPYLERLARLAGEVDSETDSGAIDAT